MDFDSIPQINSNIETTDSVSEGWEERKKEKFYKKHRELMDQRLRSRQQKSKRLKKQRRLNIMTNL